MRCLIEKTIDQIVGIGKRLVAAADVQDPIGRLNIKLNVFFLVFNPLLLAGEG
jgi:hypothetical protein